MNRIKTIRSLAAAAIVASAAFGITAPAAAHSHQAELAHKPAVAARLRAQQPSNTSATHGSTVHTASPSKRVIQTLRDEPSSFPQAEVTTPGFAPSKPVIAQRLERDAEN